MQLFYQELKGGSLEEVSNAPLIDTATWLSSVHKYQGKYQEFAAGQL